MTQMATVPSLEERDFQAINAALQVIEAIVLTRGHLPRTDRFLVELQKSIAWERRVLEEKAAKAQLQQRRKEQEQAWIDAAIYGGLPAPKESQ
jgi:hypothetical protein